MQFFPWQTLIQAYCLEALSYSSKLHASCLALRVLERAELRQILAGIGLHAAAATCPLLQLRSWRKFVY